MPTANDTAQDLHKQLLIVDPAVQFLTARTDRTDRSGLTAVGLTVPMPGDDAQSAFTRIADCFQILSSEPSFCLATTPQDIIQAKEAGRLACIIAAQDSLFVGTNLASLAVWQRIGLRILQLTYNEQNLAGSGCLEPVDGGLTHYGRLLMEAMTRYGITLDLSHAGERTFMDACNHATAPLIVSHSNPKSVRDNPRNISDDQLKAVANTGGVVCVTTYAPMLWSGTQRPPCLDDFWACLDGALAQVGIAHVGISTDSTGTIGAVPSGTLHPAILPKGPVTGALDQAFADSGQRYRQSADFNGIEDYPRMTEGLLAKGFSPQDVAKLLGENLMRVFDATWKATPC